MAAFRCAAVVTDIEGTTGSIAFVRNVLFPYAQAQLIDFVTRRRDDPEVARVLRESARVAGEPAAPPARIIAILREWMDADAKVTPLKTLQGLIWAEGYARGELNGHVYADAAAGLRRWHAAGLALYVYSSGSVAAQKLLFGHSTAGDLTPLFDDYFDTTVGPKGDVASYRTIADTIGILPAYILFLSDRESELIAADSAGWQAACLSRPEDTLPGAASDFATFATFDDIAIDVIERT